jgi:hypothetical protein
MKSLFKVRSVSSVLGAALLLILSLSTIIVIDYGITSLRINGEPLPEYGTSTGIATLERKLTILREFASQGPVDAVIIGSSVSDHGLSAAILSRDLSVAYGRAFRVFNLSTGGAEAPTLLMLYRLAHVIAAPRQTWITYPVEQNIGDNISKNSPDYALMNSPVGTALRHPLLLPFSFRLFQLPLVHYATALRDLAIYGKFVTRPASHLDMYDVDAHGDTRQFLYYSDAEPFSKHVDLRRELILSLARQYDAAVDERAKTATYFARSALEAMEKIRAAAAHDHCAVTIFAHDTSAGFAAQDAYYLEASDLFYKVISERLNAPVIDVRASFHPAGYKFADTSHLNSIGADEMSELIAAKIAKHPLPRFSEYAFSPKAGRNVPDPNLTHYTAVVVQKASDPRAELQLRYLQGPGVTPLTPRSRVQLVALMPDNNTISLPASVVSRGEVLAKTSALPVNTEGQVLLLQLMSAGAKWGNGFNLPLASYSWSDAASSQRTVSGASAKVYTAEAYCTPLQGIRGFWTGLEGAMPKDWVGVFPVGGDNGTRLSMKWTGGGAAGQFQLPSNPTARPGQYEVRLYANDGWDLLASSKPFSIGPLAETVESTSGSVKRGASVHVVWHNLDPPSKDDWVGLFPRRGPNQSRVYFKFTEGKSEGAIDLTVPANVPLGDYELRLYAAGGWALLATSAAFKVVESPVRLSVDRAAIQIGGLLRVRWIGMESPEKNDWIGLFSKERKETVRTLYHLTGGTGAGEMSFTIPPGTVPGLYEFRLYRHDGWQLAATSGPLRVLTKRGKLE